MSRSALRLGAVRYQLERRRLLLQEFDERALRKECSSRPLDDGDCVISHREFERLDCAVEIVTSENPMLTPETHAVSCRPARRSPVTTIHGVLRR